MTQDQWSWALKIVLAAAGIVASLLLMSHPAGAVMAALGVAVGSASLFGLVMSLRRSARDNFLQRFPDDHPLQALKNQSQWPNYISVLALVFAVVVAFYLWPSLSGPKSFWLVGGVVFFIGIGFPVARWLMKKR